MGLFAKKIGEEAVFAGEVSLPGAFGRALHDELSAREKMKYRDLFPDTSWRLEAFHRDRERDEFDEHRLLESIGSEWRLAVVAEDVDLGCILALVQPAPAETLLRVVSLPLLNGRELGPSVGYPIAKEACRRTATKLEHAVSVTFRPVKME